MNVEVFVSCRPTTGLGHLVRCTALASELSKRGSHVTIHSEICPESMRLGLAKKGIQWISFGALTIDQVVLEHVAHQSSDLIVIDSYEVSQQTLEDVVRCSKTLFIDDEGKCVVKGASVIVNPNVWASKVFYQGLVDTGTQVCCGIDYVLLREEIVSVGRSASFQVDSHLMLIAPGGTDVAGHGSVIQEIMAGEFPDHQFINSAIWGLLDVNDLATAYVSVDLAVIGCGTMVWEALCIGTPFVGLLLADNQVRTARYLKRNGLAPVVDCRGALNAEDLISAAHDALTEFARVPTVESVWSGRPDGSGSSRICRIIDELVGIIRND